MFFRKNQADQKTVNDIFNDFCKRNFLQDTLQQNKTIILKQVCENEGITYNKHYTGDELNRIAHALKDIIHVNAQGLSNIIDHGDDLEMINNTDPDFPNDDNLHRIARNLFRYLYRGTFVNGEDSRYKKSLAFIEKNVDEKRDPRFLSVLRDEMKKIFANIDKHIIENQHKNLTDDQDKQLTIFISGLISSYPFLDPVEDERILIPQKINNEWKSITCRVNRIDISPHSKDDPLTCLIDEKERIYAYKLVPIAGSPKNALACISLPGTTYPAGQGAKLGQIYNFAPHLSVGEGHDLTLVHEFIDDYLGRIWLTGHSKGATMAMILAAKHPDKIVRADCLNPAALCQDTLNALSPSWDKLNPNERPCINVYAQLGDIVFKIDKGFLSGTHIYRVIPPTKQCSTLKWYIPHFVQKIVEAHLHQYCGHHSVLILKINTEVENNKLARIYSANFKKALNYAYYPSMHHNYLFFLQANKNQEVITRVLSPIQTTLNILSKMNALTFVALSILYSSAQIGVNSLVKNTEQEEHLFNNQTKNKMK